MHTSIIGRLLAGAALVLYGLLIFGAGWLVVHNVVLVISLALTAAMVAFGLWMVVTGRGGRARGGWAFMIVGAALLLGELNIFVAEQGSLRTLAVLGLVVAAYMALVAVLRGMYWRAARWQAESMGKIAHFSKPYLIVNPKSGNGRAIKAHIPELARRSGIAVIVLQKGQDVEAEARAAVADGADVLGVSGGDGSIGAVAKVALEYHLPMVVLPGGTRCHFARDIGLNPKQITDSLAGFHGVERRIDVGSINGRIFLNNVSFGMYADIIDNPDYREHKREVSRHVMQAIVSGAKAAYRLDFGHASHKFHRAVQVLVGVNRYNTVDVFELGHRDRLDEGVLQVTAITKLNDAMIWRLLRAVSLKRLQQDPQEDFYQWTDRDFRISAPEKKLVVGVDGEREEYATPVQVVVIPSALSVYVPPEGERGRHKNVFGEFIAGRLWHTAFQKRAGV